MRKVAVTAFLLFYSLSIVVRTMERTAIWIAERAHHEEHRSSHGVSIGEPIKYSPHPVQTKLLEDGWGLLALVVQSSRPPDFETPIHDWLAGLATGPNSPTASPRAPPSLL
jgi:hypothetical protein